MQFLRKSWLSRDAFQETLNMGLDGISNNFSFDRSEFSLKLEKLSLEQLKDMHRRFETLTKDAVDSFELCAGGSSKSARQSSNSLRAFGRLAIHPFKYPSQWMTALAINTATAGLWALRTLPCVSTENLDEQHESYCYFPILNESKKYTHFALGLLTFTSMWTAKIYINQFSQFTHLEHRHLNCQGITNQVARACNCKIRARKSDELELPEGQYTMLFRSYH